MLKPAVITEVGLILWYLPLDKVAELKRLALELKERHGYPEPTDDSDEWTDEDLQDATHDALRRWEEREQGNDAADAQAG